MAAAQAMHGSPGFSTLWILQHGWAGCPEDSWGRLEGGVAAEEAGSEGRGRGCSSGRQFQGDACLIDEEGVAARDLLAILGEAPDHLVVVFGQAGEKGQTGRRALAGSPGQL